MDELKSPLLASHRSTENEPKYYTAINSERPFISDEQTSYYDSYTATLSSQTPQVKDSVAQKSVVYTRRWYILLLFGLLAFTQSALWNTWAPISNSSQYALGFTNSDIFLLTMWGSVSYMIAMFPLAWITDTKGLRSSCLLCSFLTTLGTGLRCITMNPTYARWFIHAGQIFADMAGPMAMGGAPAVSAVWFPARERIIATSIGWVFNTLGVAAGFVIGPLLVPEVKDWNKINNTMGPLSFNGMDYLSSSGSNDSAVVQERHHIRKYMFIEFGCTASVFLLMLIYFPSRPPSSPSVTASVQRSDFKSGTIKLLRNKQFWLISLSYGVSLGAYAGWQGTLEPLLKPHNILQKEAGWLGFYSIVGAAAGGLIVSVIAGVFSRHVKRILILLYALGSACQLWFTLICEEYITMPDSQVFLYISIILSAFLISAAIPLFFEMSCEITYPVAEGVTNGVLTLMNNIAGCFMLLVLMIPGIGVDWVNWAVVGSLISCIPALFLLKENYNRLNIDEEIIVTVDS